MHNGIAVLTLAVLTPLPVAHGAAPDRLEHNKRIARIVLEEVLGKGKIAENEWIYAPSFVAHGQAGDVGRDVDREATKGWRSAFPDMVVTVDHVVAEGDYVVVHFTAAGTNTGAGNGLPATGRKARAGGMTLFRVADGKIVEEWSYANTMSLMQQLGLLPERQQ